MKKFISILLAAVVMLAATFMFVGCDNGTDGKTVVKVFMPQQTPAITMLKLLNEKEQIDSEKYDVRYELVEGQLIGAEMGQKKADVVIAPTNMIAQLYTAEGNAKAEYQIAATTSFGAYYILTTDGTASFDDLNGNSMICQGGAAGAHAMILKSLIASKDMDVEIDYEPEASNIIQELKSGGATAALLPEPALTAVKNAIKAGETGISEENINIINLQEVWEEVEGDDGYPIASLAFKKSFLAENADFCAKFAQKVKESVEWVTSTDTNTRAEVLAALATLRTRDEGALDTKVPDAVFTDAIVRFNIGFKLVSATGMETALREYLATIAPAVAALIPADSDLFYKGISE